MSESAVDFAVFGSSPLASLVAGLLASRHKRRVIIVGEPEARYRLPRALDLSVAPITRPETWALLTANKADSAKLISKIGGRNAVRPPILPISLALSALLAVSSAQVSGLVIGAMERSSARGRR